MIPQSEVESNGVSVDKLELGGRLQMLANDLNRGEISESDLRYELWELSRGGKRTHTERFPSLSCAELDRGEFELEYLIDGMLTFGQPCIFAGGKKTLKTNILIDLALSVASGFPFLGKFRVLRKAVVGLISGESGKATIQETARRVALSKGQPLRNFTGVHFCFDLPKLGEPGDLRQLFQFIEANGIELLIVDPTYLALDVGDGASNLFSIGKQLAPLGDMMQELGCTLILCHHNRKNGKADPFDPPELEDIAWAGFQEFARQWILVGRREKFDPESNGFHKLWLNAGGSAGHASLWAVDITEGRQEDDGGRRWDVDILRASKARAEAKEAVEQAKEAKEQREQAKHREKILEALRQFPDGETENVIKDAASLSGAKSKPIILELLKENIIEHTNVKRQNNREYPGYRFTRTHSDSLGQNNSSDSIHSLGQPPYRGGPSPSVCVNE